MPNNDTCTIVHVRSVSATWPYGVLLAWHAYCLAMFKLQEVTKEKSKGVRKVANVRYCTQTFVLLFFN